MGPYGFMVIAPVTFAVVGLKIGSLSSCTCMSMDYWLRYGSCAYGTEISSDEISMKFHWWNFTKFQWNFIAFEMDNEISLIMRDQCFFDVSYFELLQCLWTTNCVYFWSYLTILLSDLPTVHNWKNRAKISELENSPSNPPKIEIFRFFGEFFQ